MKNEVNYKKMYEYLYNLPAGDKFWDNSLGGYGKDLCFRDYCVINSEKDYEKWYKQQVKWTRESYNSQIGKLTKEMNNYVNV